MLARLLSVILFLALFSPLTWGTENDTNRFVQDRLAIGFWVDPPIDEKADARYAEIAEANFTFAIGGFGARTPETIQQQLELCQKYDMKAVVSTAGVAPTDLPEHPACWGYSLRDEPSAADFSALRERVDAVREARPGRLAYINLYPNYASQSQLGTETYDEHVRRFMEEVGTDVLSMDHYPLMKPGVDTRDAYCANLVTMRKYSQQHGVPFWNFFNTMPFGSHSDPTEGQIRWQIYTSLAYGAKGVMYFCYYTPVSSEFPKGGAIIGRDDRPTRHYGQARRVNAVIKNLGPTLMKLTNTGVYRISEDDDPATVLGDTPLEDIQRSDVDPPNDYLVGVFDHEDGRQAVLLNNYRFAYTAWPTVVFCCDLGEVMEVDRRTGEEVAVLDDSPEMEGLQVSLDAGEGRLFLMPKKPAEPTTAYSVWPVIDETAEEDRIESPPPSLSTESPFQRGYREGGERRGLESQNAQRLFGGLLRNRCW